MDVDEQQDGEETPEDLKVYLPGQPLAEGEVLEADPSVYVMLHNLDVRLPFLSFDVIEDKLGDERKNVRSREREMRLVINDFSCSSLLLLMWLRVLHFLVYVKMKCW
jgi:hypothetical protein